MNLEFIKLQNLGSLLMKSSQSNFNLRSPSSYLVRSYLITTVRHVVNFNQDCVKIVTLENMNLESKNVTSEQN